MTTLRQSKHRNIVAKYARGFNRSAVELSVKQKTKHKKPKHRKLDEKDVYTEYLGGT